MKINGRNIIFGVIIIVCIFAINFAVYWTFFRNANTQENEPVISAQSLDEIAKEFPNIFKNELDYQEYNVNTLGITKMDSNKDFIYTVVEKQEIIDNRYDMNIKVPYINISNKSVEKFNENIQNVFIKKAKDIINTATNNTIYSVDYMAYINTNILSLVIKSTLKEGNNPQRVIIQTYNYNLSTNEELTLTQALDIKNLSKQAVKNRVVTKIEEANQEAENLKRLGYNVYIRDVNSETYEIQDGTNYIFGKGGNLYLIYAYGNLNFTDELDVIVF